jgi:hypothetical protein
MRNETPSPVHGLTCVALEPRYDDSGNALHSPASSAPSLAEYNRSDIRAIDSHTESSYTDFHSMHMLHG